MEWIAGNRILFGFNHDPARVSSVFQDFQEGREIDAAFFVSRHRENTGTM